MRLVRANQGCETRRECTCEDEPYIQKAGLSSMSSYGEDDECMFKRREFRHPGKYGWG